MIVNYSAGGKDGLLVNLNDAASIAALGTQLASVQWAVTAAGSGAITTEYTDDPNGQLSLNWKPTPYSKRLDVQSVNPAVAPWVNAAPVVGNYETPLPGNCTAFRIRYQTAGTQTAVSITPGLPYVPGVPVTATLYDVTSALNTAIDTGTLDISGWASALVIHLSSGGVPGFVDNALSDAGLLYQASTATANAFIWYGVGGTKALNKRMDFSSTAIAAQTSNIRIEARR